MVVIICGVSGAGKTTLGQLLATQLGWKFYEADNFHSPANVERMRLGIALSDEDRWPWLERLRELIERTVATKENAVLACSALKKSYREFLRVSKEVKFVYLRGDHELIAKQMRRRRGHFMNPELLPSQFAALEEPGSGEDVIVVDLGRAPRALVRGIEEKLHLI